LIRVVKEFTFRRSEICGGRNPIRMILEATNELGQCEGLTIELDDYDWVLVLRGLAELHEFKVEECEKANNFLKFLVYKSC